MPDKSVGAELTCPVAQPHSVPQTNTAAILEYLMAQEYHMTAAARRLFLKPALCLTQNRFPTYCAVARFLSVKLAQEIEKETLYSNGGDRSCSSTLCFC
jgi:hypothetical protein